MVPAVPHRSSRTSWRLRSESDGRLRLVKLDIDTNLGVPSRYGVLTVPTVMLFAGGEPHVTILGARPRRHFAEAFAPWTAGESG